MYKTDIQGKWIIFVFIRLFRFDILVRKYMLRELVLIFIW